MQNNQRTWALIIGLALILLVCVLAYLGTMPAEANP